MTDSQQISQATSVILYISGCSFALVGVYVLYVAVKYTLRLVSSLTPESRPKTKEPSVVEAQETRSFPNKRDGKDLKTLIKESQAAKHKKGAAKDEAAAHHHLFVNTLKGHGDAVSAVAWSADGATLATACDDASVRVFDISNLSNKEPKFKKLTLPRTPVGVAVGADPSQVVVLVHDIPDVATLALYEYRQKKQGPITDAPGWEVLWQVDNALGKDAPMVLHSVAAANSVGGVGLLVALSKKKDGRIYNMQGRQLGTLEVNSLANHGLAVSNDGRFASVASFTADTKIWEVKFSRTKDYLGTEKAMDLKGHSSQVTAVSFSPDHKRAVTSSKDGTLRVWNIDVRYGMQEDPKCLLKVPLQLPAGKSYQHLAFGPNSVIAAAIGGQLHFIAAASGELLDQVEAHDGDITAMHWGPTALGVLATASKDKRVRLWRAPS